MSQYGDFWSVKIFLTVSTLLNGTSIYVYCVYCIILTKIDLHRYKVQFCRGRAINSCENSHGKYRMIQKIDVLNFIKHVFVPFMSKCAFSVRFTSEFCEWNNLRLFFNFDRSTSFLVSMCSHCTYSKNKRRLLLRAKTTFKLTVKPFLTFLTHVAGSSAFEIKNQKSFSK